jgi:hypothetical protein
MLQSSIQKPTPAMHYNDKRTEEQKLTHLNAIVVRDTYLSKWGAAKGGASRCAFAYSPDIDKAKLWDWLASRDEMKNLKHVELANYSPPSATAAFTIYAVLPSHPSQK